MARENYSDLLANITSQALSESSKGFPCVEIGILVTKLIEKGTDGTEVISDVVESPGKLYIYASDSEKGMQAFTNKLKSLGWAGGAYATLDPEHPEHKTLVGNTDVRVCCYDEEYQGEKKTRFDVPFSGPQGKPLTKGKLGEIDAKFKQRFLGGGKAFTGKAA